MLTPGTQLHADSELAYRHERLARDFQAGGSGVIARATTHLRSRLAKLRDRRRASTDPLRGAARHELDGPLIRPGGWAGTPAPRPLGAPHHMVVGR